MNGFDCRSRVARSDVSSPTRARSNWTTSAPSRGTSVLARRRRRGCRAERLVDRSEEHEAQGLSVVCHVRGHILPNKCSAAAPREHTPARFSGGSPSVAIVHHGVGECPNVGLQRRWSDWRQDRLKAPGGLVGSSDRVVCDALQHLGSGCGGCETLYLKTGTQEGHRWAQWRPTRRRWLKATGVADATVANSRGA